MGQLSHTHHCRRSRKTVEARTELNRTTVVMDYNSRGYMHKTPTITRQSTFQHAGEGTHEPPTTLIEETLIVGDFWEKVWPLGGGLHPSGWSHMHEYMSSANWTQ